MTRSERLLLGLKIRVRQAVTGIAWFAEWLFQGGRHRYALERVGDDGDFPHLLFEHATPLVREPSRRLEEYQDNKIVNLRIASARLDGVVVGPGQVLSFCRLVGPTHRSRGYLPALTLFGREIRPAPGGGLCQLSNMVYWMALNLGFEVVERHRHQFDLFPDDGRTVPFGAGATVFYNYVNLKVRNTLTFPVKFRFAVGETVLTGRAYGTAPLPHRVEVYETDHGFYEKGGVRRRRNRIWRRISTTNPGEEFAITELVAENDCEVLY